MNTEAAAVKASQRLRTMLGEMSMSANVVAQPRKSGHVLVVFCTDQAIDRVRRKAPRDVQGFRVEVLPRPQKGSTPGLRMNTNHGRIVLRDK